MKRLTVGVAAAFILATGHAAAEGLAPPSRIRAPGAEVGPNWNGFYAGAGIGAGAASYNISGTQSRTDRVPKQCSPVAVTICGHTDYILHCTPAHDVTYTEPVSDSGTSDVGVFGVVTVGFDRVLRAGWVGGVFADYDFGSNISGDISLPQHSGSLDHNSSWAVGGRLGFLVTPSTLLYGTAGYTQAEFDVSDLGSKTFEGYFVGGGLETFLRQNWTLKLEYRFSQFGSETIVDDAHVAADLEPSMHTARVILSYKFNRD
jgi:outer membrane immunogenic protein